MKGNLLISLVLGGFICTGTLQAEPAKTDVQCNDNMVPKSVKTLADWQIIAGNTSYIYTSDAFEGTYLAYSVSAQPTNAGNVVAINPRTGKVRIQAVGKDKFEVTIDAKNPCGSTSTKFNVVIDEEQ